MSKKMSHIDLREAASNVTPPITAKPSSSLLTTGFGGMNASSVNLKQSSTRPAFEISGSQARITKVDSKQKVRGILFYSNETYDKFLSFY